MCQPTQWKVVSLSKVRPEVSGVILQSVQVAARWVAGKLVAARPLDNPPLHWTAVAERLLGLE